MKQLKNRTILCPQYSLTSLVYLKPLLRKSNHEVISADASDRRSREADLLGIQKICDSFTSETVIYGLLLVVARVKKCTPIPFQKRLIPWVALTFFNFPSAHNSRLVSDFFVPHWNRWIKLLFSTGLQWYKWYFNSHCFSNHLLMF